MKKFKVGDKIVVKKVDKVSKGQYKKGDVGVIESIDQSLAPFNIRFNSGLGTKALYLKEIKLYTPKSDNVWIPFNGGKCPVDFNTLVNVVDEAGDYTTNEAHYFKNVSGEWDSDIIAYQVMTPYISPREKVIFKNKKEMLTDLISRGELYINEEGNEHVYFSEDDIYTLGYVDNDGRSEPANDVLDELEFWI